VNAPRRRPSSAAKQRAAAIYEALAERYPDAHCELHFDSPFQLLIATILSAQTTDTSVNRVTPALFARYPTPEILGTAALEEVERLIASIGLYRTKARAIVATAARLSSAYGGEVPARMDDLLTLRGVARKTANVVLGNALGIAVGVVVDTHVLRLAARMGLSRAKDAARVERDLMALFPSDRWTMLSHLLIWHGRRVCKARGGLCADDAICRRWCREALRQSRAARGRQHPTSPRIVP